MSLAASACLEDASSDILGELYVAQVANCSYVQMYFSSGFSSTMAFVWMWQNELPLLTGSHIEFGG